MKIKKVLIIALLVLSVSLLIGYINYSKETSSKDKNIVKSETAADNNSAKSNSSEDAEAGKSNKNTENNSNKSKTNTEADSDKGTTNEENKAAEDGSIIFNSKIGLSIKFPSNWEERYTIKEDDNSIYVYFKSTDPKTRANTGLLFVIMKDFDSEDESMYDSIDGEKHFTLGNKTYFVGGPTDVSLNPENKDFDIFVAMSNERKKVIDNISLT